MAKKIIQAPEAIRRFSYLLNKGWSDSLRQLLENKHLYQRVKFDLRNEVNELKDSLPYGVALETFSNAVESFDSEPVRLGRGRRFDVDGNSTEAVLTVSNIKLYCSKCARREAFAPVWTADVADLIHPDPFVSAVSQSPFGSVQMFLLVFQCQVCQSTPETFLIRREGLSLRLEGRSPMEMLDTPKYIPKVEAKFFRDALIAMHGGKTLAALFYLRTFIEQFARRVTGITRRETGDTIMDAYNGTLPEKHRDLMPSLREWYGKLSEPIHEAREDADLFEAAREQIERHFDIRRVFSIPEQVKEEAAAADKSK